ncbi:MAG: LPP20 family lipoprotein [Treponema sp.]|jgi:hypothetical protein|nr:LPP20 family lipoprotein [Treponema sp.]
MFAKKPIVLLLCLFIFSLPYVFSGGSTSKAGSSNKQPDWVRDPYTKYNRQASVAAIGMGGSREAAEKGAYGNLIGIFGQSIQVDEKVSLSYQEAVKNGVTANWSENTTVDSTIMTSTGMDSLVGAEIGDRWDDGKEYFALAFLDKAKASQIYSGMIRSNQTMINNLLIVPPEEKNTLNEYARYQFAATIADVNISYGNLLSVIGAPVQVLKKGDDYRLEAVSITKAIPIGLRVQNDVSNRIQGAFARALSGMGFQSGGNNSRYTLDVNINSSPVIIANNPNNFTRIEVSANLSDTSAGTVLLPYNFNDRQGHTSQSEADNRAYAAAERKINEEYTKILSDYLSQLLPKR